MHQDHILKLTIASWLMVHSASFGMDRKALYVPTEVGCAVLESGAEHAEDEELSYPSTPRRRSNTPEHLQPGMGPRHDSYTEEAAAPDEMAVVFSTLGRVDAANRALSDKLHLTVQRVTMITRGVEALAKTADRGFNRHSDAIQVLALETVQQKNNMNTLLERINALENSNDIRVQSNDIALRSRACLVM